MKSLFFSFLLLIGGCTYSPNNASDCNSAQLKVNHDNESPLFQRTRTIEFYQDGKPAEMWITQSLLMTNVIHFSNAVPVKMENYNIWGEKVAECSIKDNKPFTGTVWHISLGLRGLNSSTIVTYKDGHDVSSEPYAEEEIIELNKQLGKIYSDHMSQQGILPL